MKHAIFTTYGQTPIKNIPTPIKRFTGNQEDEEELTPATTYSTEEIAAGTVIELLNQIRFLLFALVVIKVICLIHCSKK